MHDNDTQPNKPDGERKTDQARDVDQREAVKQQGSVTPEDYPANDGGRPDYKTP